MKIHVLKLVDHFRADRALMGIALLIIAITVGYIIHFGLALSPTELQIATRYTAFGDAQYYRNKWYYLLTFIGFALVFAVLHISIMVKLHSRNMRSIAIAFGYLSIIILIILFAISESVLNIAYLK